MVYPRHPLLPLAVSFGPLLQEYWLPSEVLTPTLNRVRRSRQLHIRCLRSSAPALAVPCGFMPRVTSVNQMAAYQVCSHAASVCLVDHVLYGICCNVMTLKSQRRAVACYSRGENDKQAAVTQGGSTLLGDERAHS